ncbi:GNAT family N-acetyltransferase [Nakamurella leprariae]|uniref:GNAT family N-acetyltransferase n=1 Tax=Nakamurella leprariae TaxID=2803911 RepID=A0A939BUM1_9ACTN|nr:GNAT family N-acetyltransferase [Nakamurella leprariae]MBM9465668.1 GNAT family N-acetyltransferase [Nakamurella leprariae]
MSTTTPGDLQTDVLDNASWHSLTGGHAALAIGRRRARRYPDDRAGFGAVDDPSDPAAWADLADLVAVGQEISISGPAVVAPDGWPVVRALDGVQLVGDQVHGADDPDIARLGMDDAAAMAELVDRTRPGPWRPRTPELGTYLGIRAEGRLIAMAGERLRPTGWTEISAVCTDPDFRGRGLATRLVLALVLGIRERGEQPFLHASADNVTAIRVYENLGFRRRITTRHLRLRPPGAPR